MLNNEDEAAPAKMFKGYSLFTEVEDHELKARNRATVMVNILEEHYSREANKVSPVGLKNILEYFQEIPVFEKAVAYAAFEDILKQRGIKR